MVKYICLQAVRLAAAVSFLIVAYFLADDLDLANITPQQYLIFAGIGLVNILGRLAPPVTALCIDNFKESLQAEQATAIVAKLFELHHDAMLSTPTGEFVQLIGKVFRNLDTLLPALYGAVIPVVVEVCFAVSFISIAWRTWIGLIQLGLFVVFTVAAYQ